ncbi:MAG: hypothetical protein COB73_07005 [Flavobacteriaceae bacterium]|nr:MAG: hypothetical protein COB73_07005 [Flavobacteriaceae bacterium]
MLSKTNAMRNQILSLVFFMLATTLMVVQGNSKKIETTNQTKEIKFNNVAQVDASQQNVKPIKYN